MREIRSPLDGILSPFATKPPPVALSGAATLAAGEAEAFALDFTDSSIYVKDTGTPANDIDQTGLFNAAGEAIGPQSRLTYTNPTPKQVLQADGLLKFGAHNLSTYSEAQNSWTKINVASVIENAATDPDGGNTAALITENTATDVHGVQDGVTGNATPGAGYIGKISVKKGTTDYITVVVSDGVGVNWPVLVDLNTGTGVKHTGVPSYNGSFSFTVSKADDGWVTVTIDIPNYATANTNLKLTVLFNLDDGNPASSITSVPGTSRTVYCAKAHSRRTPSVDTYVKTTSAPVYALPIDHDTSGNQIGVLVEPQATNLAVYSNDLTQAAWTPTNITPAKTATGPDGVASSSTTLTATAGNATILQSITSASSARVTSCYIKRRTGTGTIEMTQDNGSTWSSVTVTTNWSRVEIAAATITNPVVGLRIVTSGDEIDVAYFQHETGSVVTSAIETPANATVTRNADNITETASAMPYDATAGAWYIQAIVENTPTDVYLLDATAGERMLMYVDAASNKIIYGIQASSSFGVLAAGSGSITDDVAFRVAMSVTANDFAAVLDGTVDLTDASVAVSNPTTFYFGQFSSVAQQLNGHMKQVMYLPRRVSNADLQTLTSTGALP